MEQPRAPKPEAPKPEARPPEALPGDTVIGRLTIPRLHLSAIVREGDDEDTLRVALGHIPSTALPWQEGNVGVAGHRDTLFRALRRIRKNDVIVFETLSGRYVYRVQGTEIVNPRDVSVLNAQAFPELTLVTCYPFYFVGAAPERFIVKALQVTGSASEISVNAPAGLGASGVGGM
jgi:sortase A